MLEKLRREQLIYTNSWVLNFGESFRLHKLSNGSMVSGNYYYKELTRV